ncbi:MAG: ADP-ribosylation factor-like protein [Candidatus Thorarchaeota archaeon]
MLRQLHIFLDSELLFVKNYAMAFGIEELKNVKKIIQKYIDMPMPGKTFQRHVSNFKIYHRAHENLYFLIITDIIDSIQYVDEIMKNLIKKFIELFPNPKDFSEIKPETLEFNKYLDQIQRDIHSKIAIIGPAYAGKTTLYNMLRSGEEKLIMDFAKTSKFEINDVSFDIWDFQLKDNFSLLWSKFISGSDLLILLFNLANYNLKMIKHFLSLHKKESSFSKLLIIGTKKDLVEESDIKRIQNELAIPEFSKISLTRPDAKSEIKYLISEILNLKKDFPSDFDDQINKADELVLERKNIQALAKYKELLSKSESFQNLMYSKALEQKIDNLYNKIKNEVKERKEFEKTKEFEIAKPLAFTRKVTVKPLPTEDSEISSLGEESASQELTRPPTKPIKKLVTFQKLEKEKELKPLKIEKPPLKIIKKTSGKVEEKEELSPIESKELKAKMPIEIFSPHEEIKKEIKKKIKSPLVIDFTKQLQKIIIEKGSSLSLELCQNLITELQKSLGRILTMEDIETAADFFVKQEKLL